LSPEAFEHFVADLLRARGYSVQVTRFAKDGGIDMTFSWDGWTWAGQCKHYPPGIERPRGGTVGRQAVDQLLGVVARERISGGVLITSGAFTRDALKVAMSVRNLYLVDGRRLSVCAHDPALKLWG
jgi:restriction endonuclease Mrr